MCYSRADGVWKEGSHLVGRGELTDQSWSSIEPLLPAHHLAVDCDTMKVATVATVIVMS